MTPSEDVDVDASLRAAVLDLFHANQAFRAAYFDGEGPKAIDEAQRRMDEARHRVSLLQDRRF